MNNMDLIIYGLPRSGTNFLEYLVLNNLKCNYENRYVYNGEGSYVDKDYVAMKHCKPSNIGDKYIIILKKSGNFINSFKRWMNLDNKSIIKIYETALKDYYEFYNENKDDVIILFHEDLINNEDRYLKMISNKFNIELINNNIKTTQYKMGRSGGKNIGDKKYEFVDINEIKIDTTYYDMIKKIKL